MRVTKSITIVMIAMIVLSGLGIFLPVDFEKVVSAESEEIYNVDLYLQRDDRMETQRFMNTNITNGDRVDQNIDETEIVFILNPNLKESLEAKSLDAGESIGFHLHYYISCGSGTNVEVQVKDHDTVIAENTVELTEYYTLESAEMDILWTDDIKNEGSKYLLETDSLLNLRIIATNATFGAALHYNSSGQDSSLQMRCSQVKELTLKTYKIDPVSGSYIENSDNEYQPNMPPEYSYIIVKGEIRDAFGEYDIDHINVIVKDYDNEQINEGETLVDDDDIEPGYPIKYTFVWNYTGKIFEHSQNYKLIVNVSDNQGHIFSNSKNFEVTKHGVFIKTPNIEENIGSGLEKTIYLKVWNTGVDSDTITLSYSDQRSWDITLGSTKIQNLDGGKYEKISVTVKAPGDEDIDTVNSITITGETGGEGSEIKKYDAILRLIVSDIYDVDLYLINDKGQQTDEIDVFAEIGVKTEFPFYINNLGTTDDNVTLEYKGLPTDWKASFVQNGKNISSIQIAKKKKLEVKLEIEPAQSESADNIANLKIIGTSKTDNTKKDTLFINITRTFGVMLTPDKTNLTTSGGNQATFIINVKNTGEEERTFNLDSTAPPSWNSILNTQSITLEGGKEKSVTLKVTPPSDATYEENGYTITIKATDIDDELKSHSIDLTVYIEPKYGVELNIKKFKGEVKKEESVEYLIDVKSNCNIKTNIEFKIENIPKDWKTELDKTVVLLDPYSSSQIKITITPSDGTSIDDEAKIKVIATVLDKDGKQTSYTDSIETITKVKGNFLDKIEEAVGNLWIIFVLLVMVVVVSGTLVMRTGGEEWEEEEEINEEKEETKEKAKKDKKTKKSSDSDKEEEEEDSDEEEEEEEEWGDEDHEEDEEE